MFYPKINFIFWRNGYWKNYEFLKLFISYVFVKKSNFVSSLFFNVIFRFIEKISSLYRGYQTGGKLYFIRNKSSSFLIYIVEWQLHYGGKLYFIRKKSSSFLIYIVEWQLHYGVMQPNLTKANYSQGQRQQLVSNCSWNTWGRGWNYARIMATFQRSWSEQSSGIFPLIS